MYSVVRTATIFGIDCRFLLVETDVSPGMPVFEMIGYLSTEVKEAKERVRTAMKNSGYPLPAKSITVSFAPAGIRKSGSVFDLAIALGLLHCIEVIKKPLPEDLLVIGELGIDGSLRSVPGILPMVTSAKEKGFSRILLPPENALEASIVGGIELLGVRHLREAVEFLNGELPKECLEIPIYIEETITKNDDLEEFDFAFVNGQEGLRRACEVAAAGFHNMLMIGPPGSGKSMIAKCMPGILPELSSEEAMEVSKVYSVAGLLNEDCRFVKKRPFRSPHHSVSGQALIGGGSYPKPGEITLAHEGILFLDELLEFKRSTLEMLRQPLEDKRVEINRVLASFSYPANFLLLAAMNPCPCGFYPDLNRCHCTGAQLSSYMGKLSGPFLDRIDLCVEAPEISYEELTCCKGNERSSQIRKRVVHCREIQRRRYQKESYSYNGALDADGIRRYCLLDADLEDFMRDIYERLKLSVRGYLKILRTARTIADLEESENIRKEHLLEAISYREITQNYGR